MAPPPPKAPEAEEVPEVADPGQTLRRVFHTLAADVGRPVQDVALSLPPAFTGRRFEILSFGDAAIASVLELRAETFAGFYLTHLHEDELLLVYANRGRHIEFGRERCELQAAVSAEPDEFKGYGLLGLAQDEAGNFVFIVTRRYRAWVGSREKAYLDAAARFLTTAEVAAAVEPLIPIWPKDSITCALSSQGEG